MVENISIDEIDRRILVELQRNAGATVAEIAGRVGLSPTPCWRRIKRLRDTGIIVSTIAVLDAERLGYAFSAYAFIKLALPSTDNMERFERAIRSWPEVAQCERITGAADYLIKVVTSDMHAYDDFLRMRLLATGLVADVQSRIVLAAVKDERALPL